MIAQITGKLSFKSFEYVVVEVNGIGYQIYVPLSTFYELPELNQSLSLNIYSYIKEDAFQLFGFITSEEKEAFRSLIKISGIGPRLALNILSGISVSELSYALTQGDVDRLKAIPGVGKKTAERLIVELKDKIGEIFGPPRLLSRAKLPDSQIEKDAISALINLGYKKKEAENVLEEVKKKEIKEISLENLLKETLKLLAKSSPS